MSLVVSKFIALRRGSTTHRASVLKFWYSSEPRRSEANFDNILSLGTPALGLICTSSLGRYTNACGIVIYGENDSEKLSLLRSSSSLFKASSFFFSSSSTASKITTGEGWSKKIVGFLGEAAMLSPIKSALDPPIPVSSLVDIGSDTT
ncbi:uncharacterized protein A4U43_C09F11860 [Asparagus officinalis]|uniref:Uncharacterized protein n=1 Tax=Asparagus officinalis TaxID=4686 RepID=A0A5P1E6W4_ASPOF|nr:uncharacterized protein A4U43_C09F11860 [Asparagus officinalis]